MKQTKLFEIETPILKERKKTFNGSYKRADKRTKRMHKDIPYDELKEIYTVQGYIRKEKVLPKPTSKNWVPKDLKIRRWPELKGIRDNTSEYRHTLRSISPSYWVIGCISTTKQRARLRGFEHNLDKKYLMELMGYERFDYWDAKKEVCPVLGIPYSFKPKGKGGAYNSKSLDRIDNTKGYVKGNVRFMSRKANGMLLDATPEQQLQAAVWKLKAHSKDITDKSLIKKLLEDALEVISE